MRKALPKLQPYLVREDVGHSGRTVEVQYHAYRAIGRIHNLPRPSLDELKKRPTIDWKGGDGGFATLTAIQEAGPKAAFMVPALLDVLNQDPPDYLRTAVLETLGKTHPGDPNAVRALLIGLLARDEFIGEVTSKALSQVDTQSKAVVPVLAEALRHRVPAVQRGAAVVLRSSAGTPNRPYPRSSAPSATVIRRPLPPAAWLSWKCCATLGLRGPVPATCW